MPTVQRVTRTLRTSRSRRTDPMADMLPRAGKAALREVCEKSESSRSVAFQARQVDEEQLVADPLGRELDHLRGGREVPDPVLLGQRGQDVAKQLVQERRHRL